MPTFEVDVAGNTYEVDAPDETTAWRWANASAKTNQSAAASMVEAAKPTTMQRLQGSAVGGVIQGGRDLLDGASQLAYNVLPEGAQRGIDTANNWLADKTGLVGKVPEKNLSSLITGAPVGLNAKITQDEQAYQGARAAAGREGFDAARLAGNVAASAAIPGSTLARVPASMAARAGIGAVQGGALSALQPVTEGDFWSEKAGQVGTGAVTGGIMAPVAGGIARMVNPQTSPQVRMLLNEGVTPTPGQILGGRFQSVEDRLTSIPGIGDVINSARTRGLNEFNRAAYARALRGVGDAPQQVGREGVQAVRDTLSSSYDDILSRTTFQADDAFNASLQNLRGLARDLPAEEARQFERILDREVLGQMAPNGGMMGEVVKRVESQLGKQAKRFSGSADAYQQSLADALRETQSILREAVARQNPQVAGELARTNAGYANFARIRDAASRAGTDNGTFTPAQLAAAVRSGDKSVGKGATATGTAFMQDLTDAGKSVLASKYPDSGTAGRGFMGAGLLGAGAMVEPATLTAAGLASLPYLPVLNRATAAALTQRPEQAAQLANLIRQSAPLIGFGASSAIQQ